LKIKRLLDNTHFKSIEFDLFDIVVLLEAQSIYALIYAETSASGYPLDVSLIETAHAVVVASMIIVFIDIFDYFLLDISIFLFFAILRLLLIKSVLYLSSWFLGLFNSTLGGTTFILLRLR